MAKNRKPRCRNPKNSKPRCRNPQEIQDDGFALDEPEALLSLRIAMRAYFSTHKSIVLLREIIDPNVKDKKQVDYLHSTEYRSLYGQVVIHFQHFAELVCKDFLRSCAPPLDAQLERKARDPAQTREPGTCRARGTRENQHGGVQRSTPTRSRPA